MARLCKFITNECTVLIAVVTVIRPRLSNMFKATKFVVDTVFRFGRLLSPLHGQPRKQGIE